MNRQSYNAHVVHATQQWLVSVQTSSSQLILRIKRIRQPLLKRSSVKAPSASETASYVPTLAVISSIDPIEYTCDEENGVPTYEACSSFRSIDRNFVIYKTKKKESNKWRITLVLSISAEIWTQMITLNPGISIVGSDRIRRYR